MRYPSEGGDEGYEYGKKFQRKGEEGGEDGENFSEEGKEIQETRKGVNLPDLSEEVSTKSVGSTEEEEKLNESVPEPHTITSSYSSPTLLVQSENPAADSSPVSDNDGSEANKDISTQTLQWDEGGKYPY